MKYYIISGEASGDLHASNLIKQIKNKESKAFFRGWGGDLMEEQGVNIVKHYKELAFMGFLEVLLNIRTIFKNIKNCKQDIQQYQPDVVILVDYPGFNLRIAPFVKQLGIKVFYYISPQVWAWKQSRVKLIKKVVDEMFVILPFEKDFYKKFQMSVHFVGHPLLDAIKNRPISKEFRKKYGLSNKPIIALLPGSRKQEIIKMLSEMLTQVKHFKDYQFVIAGAPSQPIEFYQKFMRNEFVNIISNDTYSLLENSIAALVTSGTATLETALFKVPQVVCYKGSNLSYQIGKRLIKVKYISLVNLIMNKMVIKELIQNDLNETNLKKELRYILQNRDEVLANYEQLIHNLGNDGASEKTAQLILENL